MRGSTELINTLFIYTIAQGTPIPSHLILINEYMSRFTLQPSHGMPLQELNQSLDKFYAQYAQKETTDSWLDAHDFCLSQPAVIPIYTFS
ncbi:hypothetical protein HYQ44_012727 [Verticillium longisporum]|nr:hypothetical protein HYQ44_012727 [Verticillium longisporum]